jgi:hypothetical protein
MSSSDQNIITSLNNAMIQLNRYLSIIIYLFGTIGNILNILVLTQRALRSNSCAFLFLISSIASLIAIISGLTNKVVSVWTTDLAYTIDWLCQFRTFILLTSREVALWLITLATVDRWLLSCIDVRRRQMSTLKNAQRGTIMIIIISILQNSPIIPCYKANLTSPPSKCYGKTVACRIYADMAYACFSILIPSLLMTYFSVMIIMNVRRVQRRVAALVIPRANINTVNNDRLQRTKKKDRQLLVMLLVQVICIVALTFPQAIQKVYSTMVLYIDGPTESALRTAIENFIFAFVVLLTNIASGLPFYIYTLSGGSVFRNAFWQVLRIIRRKIICHNREN